MPDLEWNKRWGDQAKQFANGEEYFARHKIYGYQWGDPLKTTASFVPAEFINPYLTEDSVVLEIGPGGGRYSQFLQNCETLFLVEYNDEFFPILDKILQQSRCKKKYIKSTGSDFPGVESGSVDFIFSFDCFVHLDVTLIKGYLNEIRRVLKADGVAVIHYADKNKKAAQQQGTNFSDMTPVIFKELLHEHGFDLLKEDTSRISHSAIAAFRLDLP